MRTARRLQRVQASVTLAMTAKARALKASGIDVIGFGTGEPDFNTPAPVVHAAKQALDAGITKYTPAAGMPALREAIAAYYQRLYGVRTTADQVIVSVGGKHVLYNLAMALLDPGDKVLIPAPYWVSYPAQVLMADAEPVFLETSEAQDFRVTPEALDDAITQHAPRYVILNSPANPTGAAYPEDDLTALLEVFRRHPDTLLVWDAIYERIVYNGFRHVEPAQVAPDLRDRIIAVSGFAKGFAMTGWRLGYGIAPVELIAAMNKLQSHCTSGATSFAQAGAIEALSLPNETVERMVAAFDQRRLRMVAMLRAIDGITCTLPKGAFYAFPNVSAFLGTRFGERRIDTDLDLADFLLDEARVGIVPGSAFGLPGYARLSYALSYDAMEVGVSRLIDGLGRLTHDR